MGLNHGNLLTLRNIQRGAYLYGALASLWLHTNPTSLHSPFTPVPHDFTITYGNWKNAMENQNQVKHSKTRSFKEIVMNTPYASKWVAVALLAFLLLILLGMTEEIGRAHV